MGAEAQLRLMTDQSTRFNAREMVERYKAGANDEIRGGYGRELLGTILGYSIPGSRRALMEKLDSEATDACALLRRARRARCTHARPCYSRRCGCDSLSTARARIAVRLNRQDAKLRGRPRPLLPLPGRD